MRTEHISHYKNYKKYITIHIYLWELTLLNTLWEYLKGRYNPTTFKRYTTGTLIESPKREYKQEDPIWENHFLSSQFQFRKTLKGQCQQRLQARITSY